MRKFQTLKLSQFHKEKTCWTENLWSSGIMSNFWGEFFYVLGGKKNSKKKFKNILATALKMALIILFEKLWKTLKKLKKTGIISTKFSLRYTPSVILGLDTYNENLDFRFTLYGFKNLWLSSHIFIKISQQTSQVYYTSLFLCFFVYSTLWFFLLISRIGFTVRVPL